MYGCAFRHRHKIPTSQANVERLLFGVISEKLRRRGHVGKIAGFHIATEAVVGIDIIVVIEAIFALIEDGLADQLRQQL